MARVPPIMGHVNVIRLSLKTVQNSILKRHAILLSSRLNAIIVIKLFYYPSYVYKTMVEGLLNCKVVLKAAD